MKKRKKKVLILGSGGMPTIFMFENETSVIVRKIIVIK